MTLSKNGFVMLLVSLLCLGVGVTYAQDSNSKNQVKDNTEAQKVVAEAVGNNKAKEAAEKIEGQVKAAAKKQAAQGEFKNVPLAKQYFIKGKKAYDAGDYETALDSFNKALLEDPSNLVLNYLIGKSAYQLGRYDEALFAYERALALDPKHHLSRLEKGRTHFMLGESEAARASFERVLQEELPIAVQQNIELYLAQISAGQKHVFNGALMAGIICDSNATLGTAAITNIGALTADPTQSSDNIFSAALVFNHEVPLYQKQLKWKNSIVGSTSDYFTVHSLDMRLFRFSTGLEYTIKQRHLFSLMLQWMAIQVQEHLYQTVPGGTFKYSYIFSPQFTGKVIVAFNKRHHFQGASTPRSTYFGLLNTQSAGLTWLFNPRNIIDFTFNHSYDKTPRDNSPAQEYNRCSFGISYTAVLSELWNLNLNGQRRIDHYSNEDDYSPGVKRHDKALIGSVALTLKLSPTFMIDGSISYTDNNSNIDRNSYVSHQGSVKMTYLF